MSRKPKRPKSPLERVQAVAQTHWRPVPNDPDSRVPTSLEAVTKMEEVLASLVEEAEAGDELAEQLAVYTRTCVWARRKSFVGAWAAPIGGIFAVATLLLIGRHGGTDWLAASMVWAASVPLYLQAAIARQVDVNADVIAGTRTLDDRFLAFVASGPPILTPLWLAVRAAAYGLVLPSVVMQESMRRKRFVPALALVGITTGAMVFATTEPRADLAPAAEVIEVATPAPAPSGPLDPVVVAAGVEHRIEPGAPVTLTLAAGEPDTSALGEPTRVDDRSAGGCSTVLRTWTGPPKVRERASRCSGEDATTYEYVLR